MFTGIIESVGKIIAISNRDGDLHVEFDTGSDIITGLKTGESIAVNGTCLTVVEATGSGFSADVSRETIACTAFGTCHEGSHVNLERAMLLGERLDGHFVSGHVDGVTRIMAIETDARSTRFDFETPRDLRKYIAKKGSIAIDGVSLTVNYCDKNIFSVNIIPHTMSATIFRFYREGTIVNLEIDLVARYLESLVRPI